MITKFLYSRPLKLSWICSRFFQQIANINDPALLSVAIVGRPNVGKSTLFNRLNQKKSAIVSKIAGTTRDKRESVATIGGIEYKLTDTGGLELEGELELQMMKQTHVAVQNADIVFFVVDCRNGLSAMDIHFAKWINRLRAGKSITNKIYVLGNKTDGALSQFMENELAEASRLGFGEAIPISAEHGEGMGELARIIIDESKVKESRFGKPSVEGNSFSNKSGILQVAIVGRPNVGKSTLINTLAGKPRVLISRVAHTTRDSVQVDIPLSASLISKPPSDDTVIKKIRLVDTAGIWKWTRRDHSNPIDDSSANDVMRSVSTSHIVILMLDATSLQLTRQEIQLLNKVWDSGRGIVIVANKSDLLENSASDYQARVVKQIEQRLPQLGNVKVLAISCEKRTGLSEDSLFKALIAAYNLWKTRIPTSKLNMWLRDYVVSCPSPKLSSIKYITQTAVCPPIFHVSGGGSDVHMIEKWIRNGIRRDFRLDGVPIFVKQLTEAPNNRRKPATSLSKKPWPSFKKKQRLEHGRPKKRRSFVAR